MGRRKKTNPELFTKQLHSIVTKKIVEKVEALAKAVVPKLDATVVGILKALGVEPTPANIKDFYTCLAQAYEQTALSNLGGDHEIKYKIAIEKFLELHIEEAQAAQLEKLLNTFKETQI